MMKALLLAGPLAIGLSLPAMAQNAPLSAPNGEIREQLAQQYQQTGVSLNGTELTSNEIRQIQQRLYDLGFPVGNVDGIWGPVTENALQQFQRARNLQGQARSTLEALGIAL